MKGNESMTKKELLYQMFLTQYNILSTTIDELQRQLRYKRVSDVDCLELIIANERFEMLKEMSNWVFSIMKIDEEEEFSKLYKKFEAEQKKKVRF